MIRALFKFANNPYSGIEIDTTSNSGEYRDLSPFVLDATKYGSKNFENLWQYSKVYPEHFSISMDRIKSEWKTWKEEGFANPKAVRYPMGKGRIPLFSYWKRKRLGYIEARQQIYTAIYAELVRPTESYKLLEQIFKSGEDIVLRDYDAYDHIKLNMSLMEVLNNPNRKMGHAFVLIMMLLDMISKKVE